MCVMIVDGNVAKWCASQSDMINALESNLFSLIHTNVPLLERHQHNACVQNIKETERAAIITKMKLLIENIGPKNFEKLVVLLKKKQYDQCKAVLERHNIYLNEIYDFLHILKEALKHRKKI